VCKECVSEWTHDSDGIGYVLRTILAVTVVPLMVILLLVVMFITAAVDSVVELWRDREHRARKTE
jgi:ABC-type nitrate/sulfonate/bicarbonate transport system permease component